MESKIKKASVTKLDVRIAVASGICALTSTILNHFGLKFTYGEMHLEVIQKMSACIACLLCCQDDTKISFKAGVDRLMITAIGGLVGIAVILLDNLIGNQWIMVLMIALGIIATLLVCKAVKVKYIDARIGGIAFVLISSTLTGSARIWYGIFRFLSTLYGVLVVLLVTWIFTKFRKE